MQYIPQNAILKLSRFRNPGRIPATVRPFYMETYRQNEFEMKKADAHWIPASTMLIKLFFGGSRLSASFLWGRGRDDGPPHPFHHDLPAAGASARY